MNIEKRIAVACFLGGAIGALLAMQFSRYLWWVGIFIGGGVGYLSYEFKTVVQVVVIAWKEVIVEYESGCKRIRKAFGEAKDFVLSTLSGLLVFFLALLVGAAWFVLLVLVATDWSFFYQNEIGFIFGGGLFLSSIITGIVLVCYCTCNDKREPSLPKEWEKLIPLFIKEANPFVVIFYWTPKGLVVGAKNIPAATAFFRKLIKRTFILIHSEIRLLCMTDAILGALAGYFLGNVFLGGVAGVICGILNYKLVSVRWLKLAKA